MELDATQLKRAEPIEKSHLKMDDYFAILTDEERKVFLRLLKAQINWDTARTGQNPFHQLHVHPSQDQKNAAQVCSQRDRPILKIRFCATQQYSTFFHEAIQKTIEESISSTPVAMGAETVMEPKATGTISRWQKVLPVRHRVD
jgi:hypothetical protein